MVAVRESGLTRLPALKRRAADAVRDKVAAADDAGLQIRMVHLHAVVHQGETHALATGHVPRGLNLDVCAGDTSVGAVILELPLLAEVRIVRRVAARDRFEQYGL